jgi:hypothetical protein
VFTHFHISIIDREKATTHMTQKKKFKQKNQKNNFGEKMLKNPKMCESNSSSPCSSGGNQKSFEIWNLEDNKKLHRSFFFFFVGGPRPKVFKISYNIEKMTF